MEVSKEPREVKNLEDERKEGREIGKKSGRVAEKERGCGEGGRERDPIFDLSFAFFAQLSTLATILNISPLASFSPFTW